MFFFLFFLGGVFFVFFWFFFLFFKHRIGGGVCVCVWGGVGWERTRKEGSKGKKTARTNQPRPRLEPRTSSLVDLCLNHWAMVSGFLYGEFAFLFSPPGVPLSRFFGVKYLARHPRIIPESFTKIHSAFLIRLLLFFFIFNCCVVLLVVQHPQHPC